MTRTNEHGQPIGAAVPGWSGRTPVRPVTLSGRTVSLEPLGEQHVDDLYDALVAGSGPALWTYLAREPFEDRAAYAAYLTAWAQEPAHVPLAVVVDGRAAGHACFMRIDPVMGSVEVGNIAYADTLQQTTASTEAMYLMMRHVFEDLGYRRYEWKCDALNEPSRRAAQRFGFRYEGVFRQAVVYKGRNRDTAWFALTDADWPAARAAYETWLDPANFDDAGRQRSRLTIPAASTS